MPLLNFNELILKYLYQADIDNSGTIDYGEFLAATLHMNKMEREENLLAAFTFFDKDGSGYITIDELQAACKDFGLVDAKLDDMIKEIDQDNVSLPAVILILNSGYYPSLHYVCVMILIFSNWTLFLYELLKLVSDTHNPSPFQEKLHE